MIYFAGVDAVVDGFEPFLAAFLLCFTCFFVVDVVLLVVDVEAGACACAASVNPAVAKVNVRPSTADVIFRMIF